MVVLKVAWRILQFILRHRRARIMWFSPPLAKIAIIDSPNVQDIAPLCGTEKFQIIDLTGKELHLTFGIVLSAIQHTFATMNPDAGYVISLLEEIQPKITLTYIDNSPVFFEVSKRFRGCRFLAIQNAARYDTLHLTDEQAAAIHLPEFACFGNYEKDLYTRRNASVGRFYPVGCVKDSYYREGRASQKPKKDIDVCVVAEASPNWDRIEFPGMEDAIGNIAKHAVRFCSSHNKRLWIAGKREENTLPRLQEVEWYRKYIGDEVQVMPRLRAEYTTYDVIDRSAVSISFISTALQEGFSRGNRVLFCNFTGQSRWNFPVDGIWLLKDSSYEAFEERLLALLAMTDETFWAMSSDAAKYVLNYNADRPTHVFLRELIADAVNLDGGYGDALPAPSPLPRERKCGTLLGKVDVPDHAI